MTWAERPSARCRSSVDALSYAWSPTEGSSVSLEYRVTRDGREAREVIRITALDYLRMPLMTLLVRPSSALALFEAVAPRLRRVNPDAVIRCLTDPGVRESERG